MNKHQKLAMLVAPFLIIGGYVAADYYAAAQARAEMDNKAGRLTTVDGCNLQVNKCTLQKGNLEMKLMLDPDDQHQLLLVSNEALEGVSLALDNTEPAKMTLNGDNQHWKIGLTAPVKANTTLKLITSINEVLYFIEIGE